jgi:hypothetical protein
MLPWWRKGSGRAWPVSPWHRRLPLSFAAFHVMKCLLSVPSTGGVIENCFTQHLQYCQSQEESSSESSRFEIQVEDSQEACRKCRNRIEAGIPKTERETLFEAGAVAGVEEADNAMRGKSRPASCSRTMFPRNTSTKSSSVRKFVL